ncbi:hypothetical protein H4Q26_012462 [Puccinia striiformis f. sp. tritici PST-130]|nr:hypothetical protein H4Q26_012462 [Puccinia striiformis f. sp. tritici PST-130]
MEDQIPRPSSEGSSTRMLDNPRGPNWIECAVCLIEFDITALEDEELVPDQPPLRKLVACHHTFHKECIDQWLRDPRKTCPHCRAPSKDDGIFRLNPGPDLSGPIADDAVPTVISFLLLSIKREEQGFEPVTRASGRDMGLIPKYFRLAWLCTYPCRGDPSASIDAGPRDELLVTIPAPYGEQFWIRFAPAPNKAVVGTIVGTGSWGAESLPSFHATSIEPDLSSLSPPTLPQSGLSTHNPSPTHRNSNEPGTVGLRTIVSERPKAEEHIRRPSIEGTSICVGDKPRGQNWIGCAVCMEEFDITALKDEKLVPSQAPLRQLVACHHTYHKECIDTWLRDPRNTCPHCRTPSTDDDIIRVKPSPDFASTVIQERYTGPLATRPSESPCFGATVAIFVILIWAAVVFEMIRASHYNHPSYHP